MAQRSATVVWQGMVALISFLLAGLIYRGVVFLHSPSSHYSTEEDAGMYHLASGWTRIARLRAGEILNKLIGVFFPIPQGFWGLYST